MPLRRTGTVRDARGFASSTYSSPSRSASWRLSRPRRAGPGRELTRSPRISASSAGRHRRRRQHARGIAGVHSGRLDVLEDRRPPRRPRRRRARRRRARAHPRGTRPRATGSATEISSGRARDVHAPAAEDVVRADEHGIADPLGDRARFLAVVSATPQAGARRPSSASSAPKRPRSSARSIAASGSPRSGTPAAASAGASPSGVCPPSETTTPSGFSSAQTSSTRSCVSGSR